MQATVENLDTAKVKLVLDFEADEVQKAYNQVLKSVSKDVKIPGFRPGQVPKNILESRLQPLVVKQYVLEKLVENNLEKTLKEKNLKIFSQPMLEEFDREFVYDKNLSLPFTVELIPSLNENPSYKGQKITVLEEELDVEAEIPKQLTILARAKGELLEDVEIVEEFDRISIDYEGKFTDNSFMPDAKGKNKTVTVTEKNFAPGLLNKLIGCKKGEEKEITITFPEYYVDGAFAGKEASFKVKINNISRQKPLVIDDELAKQFDCENLEALKEKIKKEYEEEIQKEALYAKNLAIINHIAEANPLEIPAWLNEKISANYTKVLEQDEEHVHDENFDHDHDHDDEDEENHENKKEYTLELTPLLKKQILNKAKVEIFFLHLLDLEKVPINNEEFSQFIKFQDMYYKQIYKKPLPDKYKQQLFVQFVFKSTLNWLVDNNEFEIIKVKPDSNSEDKIKLEKIAAEMALALED